MKFSTVLKEGDDSSPFSARRFIAFILVLDSIFNTVFAMVTKITEWHIYLIILGVPLIVATLLLFCTTINDVINVTSSFKKQDLRISDVSEINEGK